ncbi:hypothetical protein [Mucilaginibacter sp. KACC 22063]|uniref:hypothetical protein n=1 Tax=Mucilaginibacter sp. KACC 22063 TaxID=3025666 RepID=UPI002366F13B|nr:hypothetical protein [Mucilaginibacter sp. KACC 22063]WDF53598.1 hypothetical protein PQ461_11645 [Mucilaginibacter sp. KACC 22063]
MLVNAYTKPDAVALEVVDGKKDLETALEETARGNNLSVVNPNEPTNNSQVALQKMFNITFSYLQKAYKTKVLKAIYRGNPIYKVVLNSDVSKTSLVCWFKRQKQEWILLLGDNINPALMGSITYAIDRQE